MDKSQLIVAILFTSVLILLIAGFLLFVMVWYRKKRNEHILEQEMILIKYNQELLQTQLEIQEQTFKTISEEIHDNIGQSLSFIKLQLSSLETKINTPKSEISTIIKVIGNVIHDLRDITRSLNSDFIKDVGLQGAIKQQIQVIKGTGKCAVDFKIHGDQIQIQNEKELVAFRIVQELLNNIIKHANATLIEIEMCYSPHELKIAIKDNGKGFKRNVPVHSENGIGLRNIDSRIRLIHGTWILESTIEKGTLAVIQIPV